VTAAGTTSVRLQRLARSALASRLFWICIGVWIVTRALMVVQVGYWNHAGANYQDAGQYQQWSEQLAFMHVMPIGESWQYPPGAAFLILAPRAAVSLLGVPYPTTFVASMLLLDLAGLALMALLARRTGRNIGVWVWLLAIPVMQSYPILHFDLVPTVLAMAALIVIHRRPDWFGSLAGLGAAIKVWPIVLLFGEWDRRRLLRSAAIAAGVVALAFGLAAILFGSQSGFFDNQDVRGLEVEAVGGIPWYARETVTGKPPPVVDRDGTQEIASAAADAVGTALKWLGLLVLIAAALWWLARERAIRRGRLDLAEAAVSRDFVFAIVMLQIVVSRVLSPQYMIWLVGLAAVILTAGTRRMARPAWVAIGAVVITAGLYQAPANMLIRNLALIVAALDATMGMVFLLRDARTRLADDGGGEPARRLRAGWGQPRTQPPSRGGRHSPAVARAGSTPLQMLTWTTAPMRDEAIYLVKAGARRLRFGPGDFLAARRRDPANPPLPPRHLAFVGAGDYEATGRQFLGFFRELGGLDPGDRVLDVGCGIGRMAMPLTEYLQGGSYAGFDIGRAMVRWCQREIGGRWPNFEFAWAPIHNSKYNPFGDIAASEFRFPYADDEFDFAFATSLFTHLLPEEARHYLAETARVLKPGGRCLLTFFLLTHEAERELSAGRTMLDFAHPIPGGRTTDAAQPEEATAFPTDDVRAWCAGAGLAVREPIHYGVWSGTPGATTLQDMVVAERLKGGRAALSPASRA
jgi:SAM-dependent methyltransferase